MKKYILCLILLLALTIPLSVNLVHAENTEFSHYVVDYDSGKVLSHYNENERHEIASMVKIMTLNVIFDAIDDGRLSFDDKITISKNAAKVGGSGLLLDEGSTYRAEDLIKGIIVVSANDAATALAEYIANNTDNFVAMMNDKASELSMTDTHFVNVTGLPKDGQYSTAHDVSIMTRALMQHKEVFDYSSIWTEDFTHPSGRITNLTNTNKLVRFYEGCDVGKTGFTEKAGFCLSCSAKRGDMRVIATVIGCENSKSRFKITSDLMNDAFNNYSYKVLKHSGEEIVNDIIIRRARTKKLALTYSHDVKLLMLKDEHRKIAIDYNLPSEVKAPIQKGDKIGECYLMVDGEIVDTIDIVAKNSVDKSSLFDNLKMISSK